MDSRLCLAGEVVQAFANSQLDTYLVVETTQSIAQGAIRKRRAEDEGDLKVSHDSCFLATHKIYGLFTQVSHLVRISMANGVQSWRPLDTHIRLSPDTGHISGITHWAEAEICPFGISL